LDGQVQLWDIRDCKSKAPASLRLTISTPFSVRHIHCPSVESDDSHSCAHGELMVVQYDGCVRIYDLRRPSVCLSSIEHTQRITSIDWIRQASAIATLSMDNSLQILSTNGQLLAESIANESTTSLISSKVK
jgi:WD40 repeat protein